MQRLYVGMKEPYSYTQNMVAADTGPDLTEVTAASFQIRKPDGSTTSWNATLSNQTSTTLTLTYDLGTTSPLDQAGTWKFYAALTVPSGTERTEDWFEQVHREHGDG